MKNNKKTFEEQLSRLEEIVGVLDKGDIPLEDMVNIYQEGMTLTKTLREFLNNAEMKVVEINKLIEKQEQD